MAQANAHMHTQIHTNAHIHSQTFVSKRTTGFSISPFSFRVAFLANIRMLWECSSDYCSICNFQMDHRNRIEYLYFHARISGFYLLFILSLKNIFYSKEHVQISCNSSKKTRRKKNEKKIFVFSVSLMVIPHSRK